jgi:hypothetical protein
MSEPVTVQMPLQLTPEMIRAVRNDPLTSIEDKDEWHKRLGWLICAYDVLIAVRMEVKDPK